MGKRSSVRFDRVPSDFYIKPAVAVRPLVPRLSEQSSV